MKKYLRFASVIALICFSFAIIVSAANFKMNDVIVEYDTVTYSGKENKPQVKVKSLKLKKDYYVTYANNINAGRATVIVDEVNDRCEPVYKYFDIIPCDISKCKITLKYTSAVYNGKAQSPSVTVTFSGKTLKKDKDYTVKYSKNKNVGKAVVTINGIGNFKGKTEKYYYITPSKVTSVSVKIKTDSSVSLNWNKVSGASGYQVYQYKDKKWERVKTCESNSCKIKKLKSDKSYKFKVRAIFNMKDKTLYGAFSDVLTAKTKLSRNDYVYITSNGSKYHRKNCSYIKSGKKKVTYGYALDHKYGKCSRCFK